MNVTIGIPMIGDMPGEAFYYHALLISSIRKTARICLPPVLNMTPHDRARLHVFDIAEKNNSDYVLFLDADMIIPETAFCDMLDAMNNRVPKPCVVSGHYYRRGWPYTCVWSKFHEGSWAQVDAQGGIHPIDISGFGCCLIDMKWVLRNLERPYSYQKGPTEVTDDVSFFEQVKLKGGTVLGHAEVRCGHLSQRTLVCDRTATHLRQYHMAIERDLEKELAKGDFNG